MHGIHRTRNIEGTEEDNHGLLRIVVRYSDGRVLNFVPDAGRDTFSEDDALELKKVLDRASAISEWAEVTHRSNLSD
jgi:hypothetical protein